MVKPRSIDTKTRQQPPVMVWFVRPWASYIYSFRGLQGPGRPHRFFPSAGPAGFIAMAPGHAQPPPCTAAAMTMALPPSRPRDRSRPPPCNAMATAVAMMAVVADHGHAASSAFPPVRPAPSPPSPPLLPPYTAAAMTMSYGHGMATSLHCRRHRRSRL